MRLPHKYWSWTSPSEPSLGSDARPQARSSGGDLEEGVLRGKANTIAPVVGRFELNRKTRNLLHSPPPARELPEEDKSHKMEPLFSPVVIDELLPHPGPALLL